MNVLGIFLYEWLFHYVRPCKTNFVLQTWLFDCSLWFKHCSLQYTISYFTYINDLANFDCTWWLFHFLLSLLSIVVLLKRKNVQWWHCRFFWNYKVNLNFTYISFKAVLKQDMRKFSPHKYHVQYNSTL